MFTAFRNFVKPTTGLITHCVHWILSSTKGEVYLRKNSEIKPENEIAIYCVHGTCDRSSAFSTLISRLLPMLPPEITYIEMLSFKERAQGKSIENFSEQLKNKIIKNSHQNIILMGHSRGGLVAAHFAENLANEMNINILQIVCISAPWGGSYYAFFPVSFFSSSVDEMKPNSQFLKNLTQQISSSKNKYLYFIGDSDYLVKTHQACIQEEKHQKQLKVLDDHGHLSIMTSKTLANDINKSINERISELKSTAQPKSP